jgi:hypothetical protein
MMLSLLLQAAVPVACPTPAAPLPAAMAGRSAPVQAAAGRELAIGRAARVSLAPTATVRFAAAPERAGKPGDRGGAYAFRIASAGMYRVALDSAAWVDVVGGGKPIASAAHGHGNRCTGIRKMVDYRLTPGRYVLQLSGATQPAAVVMVARFG